MFRHQSAFVGASHSVICSLITGVLGSFESYEREFLLTENFWPICNNIGKMWDGNVGESKYFVLKLHKFW